MHGDDISYAYGFWSLVIVNVALFAFFILSYLAPVKKREWRSMGVTLAFFVALFTEMSGFPLTIYLLSGWLGSRYPGLDLLSHDAGHLWNTLLGWKGDPHFNPLHLLSNVFIFGRFLLPSPRWKALYQ